MKTIRLSAIVIAALSLAALVPGVPASAVEHDHWQVVGKICQTALTPGATAGHEEFVTALDRERTLEETWVGNPFGRPVRNVQMKKSVVDGWGVRTTDFSGPRPLELAYADCVQAR